jgi:hypothetical protein
MANYYNQANKSRLISRIGGAFVPAFSNAQAAERPEGNFPFPPNSQMEQFFRRFASPDAGRDNWWQQDWPFPRNSQIEQFFRGFGSPDAGRDTRGWIGVQIQLVTAEIADSLAWLHGPGRNLHETLARSFTAAQNPAEGVGRIMYFWKNIKSGI